MRIFPIAANADQKVQITYYQELDVDHDAVTYVYPLATVTKGPSDTRTTGRFAFQLEAKSAIPISSPTSPSHGSDIIVADHSDSYKLVSLEKKAGSLADDIVIRYDLHRPQSGIDLLTSRHKGEDGFYYLTITAGKDLTAHNLGMDYLFVLDISGSMANDNKLPISRQSLGAFIAGLAPTDRFEVMTFNVAPNTAFNQFQPATEQTKTEAVDFLSSQAARGGTILAPALITAYKYGDPDRRLNVVILSDGMTEQTERRELIDLIGQRPSNARVFCIGIGNEINRPLLEQMAEDSGGLAAFISGEDDFKRQAKAFRRKLMRPVAEQLDLRFEGVTAFDQTPQQLPNLYFGAPVRVYGRYAGQGPARIVLTGQIEGRAFEQIVDLNFPQQDNDNPEIERMWAQKRIGELLKTADRMGDRAPVIDEVIELGEVYSIVTEYTSFLVLENDAEYQRWKIDRRNRKRLANDRAAQQRRREELDLLREQAIEALGPQATLPKTVSKPVDKNNRGSQSVPQTPQTPPTPMADATSRPNQSRNFGRGFGSGPVGPLFIGIALWMKRRKKKI